MKNFKTRRLIKKFNYIKINPLLRSQNLAGNSTCYERQLCYTEKG